MPEGFPCGNDSVFAAIGGRPGGLLLLLGFFPTRVRVWELAEWRESFGSCSGGCDWVSELDAAYVSISTAAAAAAREWEE